ncbi:MAG: glutathione S-transferase family protein [Candidatus Binatia bacterium]
MTLHHFVVHGLTPSFFTRKVTGYLDYKGLPWRLQPSIGINIEARAAGWNGGIPVVTTPAGELIWDSTAVILHLEHLYPIPAVLPADPLLAFLAYVLDDFSDEWLYRHAVGTRWLYPQNATSGSWDIAREGSREFPGSIGDTHAMVSGAMTACLPRLGTTPQNIDAWVAESLMPWQRALAAHVETHGYLLGGRPSLADFALFGGNIAHFINDPLCCAWMEASATAVVGYTHALLTPAPGADKRRPPGEPVFGDWLAAGALPESLVALLAETGRHYLPWVARATREGSAVVHFEEGDDATIATTNFLTGARGILLARYLAARSPQLDAVLERAGIRRYFADYTGQATAIPDPAALPRPDDNQPFPAGA